MNQGDAEKLVKSLFPNLIILPNSDRSAYSSDKEWEDSMIKHKELSEIVDIWNAK